MSEWFRDHPDVALAGFMLCNFMLGLILDKRLSNAKECILEAVERRFASRDTTEMALADIRRRIEALEDQAA